MKKILFIIYLIIQSYISFAQNHKEKISQTAKLMVDGIKKGDYSIVLDYTYPILVNAHGGKDSVLKGIKDGFKSMKAAGREIIIKDAKIGVPGQEIKIGTLLYSVIPETVIISMNGADYATNGSLIGISSDNGVSWTFVDVGSLAELRKFLPDVDKLSIPESSGPMLLKK